MLSHHHSIQWRQWQRQSRLPVASGKPPQSQPHPMTISGYTSTSLASRKVSAARGFQQLVAHHPLLRARQLSSVLAMHASHVAAFRALGPAPLLFPARAGPFPGSTMAEWAQWAYFTDDTLVCNASVMGTGVFIPLGTLWPEPPEDATDEELDASLPFVGTTWVGAWRAHAAERGVAPQ
jgi:hypothetical protein